MKKNGGHILVGSLWNDYESPSSHKEKMDGKHFCICLHENQGKN